MKLTFNEIELLWNKMTDKERVTWLLSVKDQLPEYTIYVDNDEVFLSFDQEDDDYSDNSLNFNEFGYYLLVFVFEAIGLNAELV